jgi:peptidoglycan/LPS O-acetylase OafA/YrhL
METFRLIADSLFCGWRNEERHGRMASLPSWRTNARQATSNARQATLSFRRAGSPAINNRNSQHNAQHVVFAPNRHLLAQMFVPFTSRELDYMVSTLNLLNDMCTPLYPSDIKPLTSLRFFAAMAIVLLHFQSAIPQGVPHLHFDGRLSLAVDFFFVLSGFILAHANIRKWTAGEFEYRPFIVKRFARIYPMHLATLAFYVLVGLALFATGKTGDSPGRYDFRWLVPHLLMINAWTIVDHGSFNYPSWSISAEWSAYLLFPLFCFVVLSKKAPAWLILAGSALALVLMYAAAPVLLGYPFTGLHSQFGFYRIFPEFAFGAALYRFGWEREIKVATSSRLVLILLLAALYILKVDSLIFIFLFGAIIFAYAETARQNVRTILNNKFLIYLGEISYSIYMIHAPVATVWFKLIVPRFNQVTPMTTLLGALIVIPCAALTYRWIELPARAHINGLMKRRKLLAEVADTTLNGLRKPLDEAFSPQPSPERHNA